jgi:hypothetical protein
MKWIDQNSSELFKDGRKGHEGLGPDSWTFFKKVLVADGEKQIGAETF